MASIDSQSTTALGGFPFMAFGSEVSRVLTMSEQIANNITMAILRGEYNPGDPVREQELADRFQVSRGPIREALRILEKSGVVTIVPQRGAHVTRLSAEEVNYLFEIRLVLARLLAKYLDDVDSSLCDRIHATVTRLEQIAGQNDSLDEYAQGSYLLSTMLFEASRNRQLSEILLSLANQTARYTRFGLREPERRLSSVSGWRRLIDALRRQDSETAGDVLAWLIEESRQSALKALK